MEITDRLPPLRDDLKLVADMRAGGKPSFRTLHDPVRNRFFRFGPLESEILKYWPKGQANTVLECVNTRTPYRVTPDAIFQLLRFFRQNLLLSPADDETRKRLLVSERRQFKLWSWFFHHYLYIRLPLFHPDRFLFLYLPEFDLRLRPLETRVSFSFPS